MDDLEFRRRVIINPVEVEQQKQCEENTSTYRHIIDEQLQFEEQLNNTLNISVPDNLADKILFRQVKKKCSKALQLKTKYAYILVSAMLILVGNIWLLNAQQFTAKDNVASITSNLDAAVMAHLYEDSHALDTYRAYSKVDINTMLASMGGKFSDPIGNVSYLSRCIVGKNMGLHMVVKSADGLVTVLLLPSESITKPTPIADNHFLGVMLPSQKGVVVIVSEKKDITMAKRSKSIQSNLKPSQQEIIRERVEKNLRWII